MNVSKVDFRTRNIIGDGKEQYIVIERSIH